MHKHIAVDIRCPKRVVQIFNVKTRMKSKSNLD